MKASITWCARARTEIVVVPIFMAAGSHVKKDLPQMAAGAMDRHAGLVIELAAPVGEADPRIGRNGEYALNAEMDKEADKG